MLDGSVIIDQNEAHWHGPDSEGEEVADTQRYYEEGEYNTDIQRCEGSINKFDQDLGSTYRGMLPHRRRQGSDEDCTDRIHNGEARPHLGGGDARDYKTTRSGPATWDHDSERRATVQRQA